jgi:hypothetical protein
MCQCMKSHRHEDHDDLIKQSDDDDAMHNKEDVRPNSIPLRFIRPTDSPYFIAIQQQSGDVPHLKKQTCGEQPYIVYSIHVIRRMGRILKENGSGSVDDKILEWFKSEPAV